MNIFQGVKQYEVTLNFLSKLNDKLKLLEVGARDELMKPNLPSNISYSSLDVDKNCDYKVDLNKKKIPVKDNFFNILVCLETLEHTFYPKKILKEFKRVTKKDGTLILSMPNEYNLWLRLNYLFGRKMKHTDEPFEIVSKYQHIHKPRVKDILDLFSQEFRIVKIIPIWQSRLANKNGFYSFFDKFIDLLAKVYPSLFARLILVIAKNDKKE